jgi:hypothetical protein
MDDSQHKQAGPSEEEPYVLKSTIRPAPVKLGLTYQGAILEGYLHISPAKEVRRVHIDKPDGQEVLELYDYRSGRGEIAWRFRARTDRPIKFVAFVGFWTDLGKTSTHFSLEVKAGPPPGGRILICESPFGGSASELAHANLNLIRRELELQANAADELPEDLAPFHMVLLHCQGLRFLTEGAANRVKRYLEAGGRVVLLADHFYLETVAEANHLTECYGIRLQNREYQEVLCDRSQIEDHEATIGVRRVRWFRPSPIVAEGPAKLLIRNPENPGEGFLACGGPHQNLFLIGTSLLDSLVCEGWPFDNGQLLANLLKTR